MPYGKLILKLKGYARNKKLDREAASGKPAVDVGRVAWSNQKEEEKDWDPATEENGCMVRPLIPCG